MDHEKRRKTVNALYPLIALLTLWMSVDIPDSRVFSVYTSFLVLLVIHTDNYNYWEGPGSRLSVIGLFLTK